MTPPPMIAMSRDLLEIRDCGKDCIVFNLPAVALPTSGSMGLISARQDPASTPVFPI
jgi:hypothetical protein